jgi:dipeptidyl aminopeptidase/acylaminoacyl peptidase
MKSMFHTRSSVRTLPQRIAAVKKSTLILLTAAASLLSGCDSSKIDGVNPTAPPAKLVQAGWKSSWSPDGRQLVHGTGQGGGLEVLDLRTHQTTVLIANAKDPAWSPDGRWIAFIREESYNQYLTEEVWVVPVQGGKPRRVVTGGFPSWSADGLRLFVHSRRDNRILAANPNEPASQPAIFFTNTPSWYFSVSPDQTRVAFGCRGRLDIRDCATGQTVAEWPTPGDRGLLPAWSPDGRMVAFGGFDDSQLGLWVFEAATGHAKPVLKGHYTMPSWSRDSHWLAFDERTDSRCIWIVGRSYIDGLLKDVTGATSVPPAR